MANDQQYEKTIARQDYPVKSPFIPQPSFLQELRELINKYSKENDSNTSDFILAQYLNNCLHNFNIALQLKRVFNNLSESVLHNDNEAAEVLKEFGLDSDQVAKNGIAFVQALEGKEDDHS